MSPQSKPYNLFLDDIREPSEVGNYMNPVDLRAQYRLERWIIARNYKHFVLIIERNGMPDKVSFDHDLADCHYASPNSPSNEKTGYDCAKWLIDYVVVNKLPLPTIFCHSMNPVGKDNILSLFRRYRDVSK